MAKIENFSINLTTLSNGFVVVIDGYGSRYRLPATRAFADSLESASSLITDALNGAEFNAIDMHDEQAKLAAAQQLNTAGSIVGQGYAMDRAKGY
jgi:hypothetical protein